MNEEYEKRLLNHLKNIDRIFQQEAKKLRFELTVKYIGEVIGRDYDHEMALDVLREATR